MEQLGLRDHRWHLDFLSYPPRHTPLPHPTSLVWRFLPGHQHSATCKPGKWLANRWSNKHQSSLLNPNQMTGGWQFIPQWEFIPLLCGSESLTNCNVFLKTQFFFSDHPIFRKLTQRTKIFETTYWYFHISIVSLDKQERKKIVGEHWKKKKHCIYRSNRNFLLGLSQNTITPLFKV